MLARSDATGAGASRTGAEPAGQLIHDQVRRRLRALRAERGLTLAEVADAAGMSLSTLSRLETGARRLALDHLPALARGLGVPVDALLAAPERPADPRVRRRPRTVDGITALPLTHRGPASGLAAFKVTFPADRTVPDLRVHEGHDWLYVLAGRLRLVLGEEELVLEPGQAAEFSTRTPHWMGAVDGPVEVIAIFGPHGERMHVHRRPERP
jgi:transcriptional regulator with XRE-family HTH domain